MYVWLATREGKLWQRFWRLKRQNPLLLNFSFSGEEASKLDIQVQIRRIKGPVETVLIEEMSTKYKTPVPTGNKMTIRLKD